MKRIYYLSALPALLLAACTQSEEFVTQQTDQTKTMKFDVAFVGKNSRATGNMTTAKLNEKEITIWGAAYQGTTGANGIWITTQEPLTLDKSTTDYWYAKDKVSNKETDIAYPGSNYTTYFTAIAPADEFQASTGTDENKPKYSMAGQYTDGSSAPESGTRKLTLSNIPVVQEAPALTTNTELQLGTDYLIACANSTTEEVSLQFKHLLSRLKFAVWTDENTMETPGSETTKIELNKIVFYLPGTGAKAKYVQSDHNVVAGNWSWSDFTNTSTVPNETDPGDYQAYTLITGGEKEVKYYSGPTAAHGAAWDEVKLTDEDKTFFIAPNGSTPCQLYMDIEYTVKRKVGDAWSTTDNSSATSPDVYSAGHKVVKRTGMKVPVGDAQKHDSADTDTERNEGLSHFHQGVNEILYICLRADQKVAFSTEFSVDNWYVQDWVDDPIDASKNQ